MYSVYLAGPDTSVNWREDLINEIDLNIVDFVNPGDIEVSGTIFVQEALSRLKDSDAVLLRLPDEPYTYNGHVEMVVAQAFEIPVFVWHDGQELSPWVQFYVNGESNNHKQAVQELLELL